MRGLLGEEAPISASTVARLKERWNAELAAWRARPLEDLEVVYMWVDGVYVKAGLEREKAAILVVMAALSDGSKVVLSVVPGYRESTRSWSEVLSNYLKILNHKCIERFQDDSYGFSKKHREGPYGETRDARYHLGSTGRALGPCRGYHSGGRPTQGQGPQAR